MGTCEAFLAGSSVPGFTPVLVRVMLWCVGQQDKSALWSVRTSEHSLPFLLLGTATMSQSAAAAV